MACGGAEDPDSCSDACRPPIPRRRQLCGYPVDCSTCRALQLLACGERSGCHDPIAAALCCNDRECPPGSPDDCGDTRCPTEFRALGLCLGYAAEECLSYSGAELSSCFAR